MGNGNNNKEGVGAKIVVPQPIGQMRITILNNGTLAVNGIPGELNNALGILADATKAVVNHFVTKAKEGGLDDKNAIIVNKIIVPDKKIIM